MTPVTAPAAETLPALAGGVRMLLATLIVLAALILLAWLVRRGSLRLPGRGVRHGVTVESAVSLGERRSLVVVSVEGRRLLLGMTPVQISLVTELDASTAAFDAAMARRMDGQAPS